MNTIKEIIVASAVMAVVLYLSYLIVTGVSTVVDMTVMEEAVAFILLICVMPIGMSTLYFGVVGELLYERERRVHIRRAAREREEYDVRHGIVDSYVVRSIRK